MSRVIVGVDPHKKSVTIEAVDEHGTVLATGRFGTDSAGYRLMLNYVRQQWPHRRWAVEGAHGVGWPPPTGPAIRLSWCSGSGTYRNVPSVKGSARWGTCSQVDQRHQPSGVAPRPKVDRGGRSAVKVELRSPRRSTARAGAA
jgi:hypothetical protein